MPAKMPIAPTADLIQTHKITEDQNYEFKSKVDLNDKKAKSDFLDDVVVFLNAESAYLMIGVREKGGKFDRFEPVSGNRDEIRRRFTSIIQDNITPLPTKIQVDFIDVEGGFVINIFVPDHGMRPYQNSINGSFYLRTGAQNRPIPRDQIRSMFTTFDQFEIDVERLMERENRAVEDRDIMQNNGVTFHLAIIPREHYERNRPSFNPKDGTGYGTLKGMSHFHYGSYCVSRLQ